MYQVGKLLHSPKLSVPISLAVVSSSSLVNVTNIFSSVSLELAINLVANPHGLVSVHNLCDIQEDRGPQLDLRQCLGY